MRGEKNMDYIKKIGLSMLLVCITPRGICCNKHYHYPAHSSLSVSHKFLNPNDVVPDIREWAQQLNERAGKRLEQYEKDFENPHITHYKEKELGQLMYKFECIQEVSQIVLKAIQKIKTALSVDDVRYLYKMHNLYPAELKKFIEESMKVLYAKIQHESNSTNETEYKIEELFPEVKEDVIQAY